MDEPSPLPAEPVTTPATGDESSPLPAELPASEPLTPAASRGASSIRPRRHGRRRAGCLLGIVALAALVVGALAVLPMLATSVARAVLPAFGITATDLEIRISDGSLELLDLRADRVEVFARGASAHGVTAGQASAVVRGLDLAARTFGAVSADLIDVTGAFAGQDVTFARAHIASSDGDHATVRLVLASDELLRRVDQALATAGRPDVRASIEDGELVLAARGTTRVRFEARDGAIHLVSERFGDLPVVDVRGHGITIAELALGPDGLVIDATGSLRRLLSGG